MRPKINFKKKNSKKELIKIIDKIDEEHRLSDFKRQSEKSKTSIKPPARAN